ncbi:PAS domain S-box protein [Fulvivirga ulvae]|uniref:hybrid sensor histidine kinase/response regulator n=1 Tax=Fulvivirga ulvae TaxID=2904245 RepID=UPI001F2A92A2|nr:PAS domain S-box protein [Fulvivirga ulvae]UII33821.1 PAS domain S-box protein [Fulvivirga ulvae]
MKIKEEEFVEMRMNRWKPINVLIIEDSEDDYELIKRRIRREGYNINAVRVETAEEYEATLDGGEWDVVISDNSLPQFNARSALAITRKNYPFMPFIIVSGTIGEEAAVEAMRLGANDYLLKNDLARLMPAIEREIRDAEIIKAKSAADRALKESQERYRLLAENIQDLVCLHSPDSTYLWVGPSTDRILGYHAEELIGLKHLDLMYSEDLEDKHINPFDQKSGYDGRPFSYRIKRKDGAYIYLETMLQHVYEDNRLIRIVSTSRDITEQKLAHNLLIESEAKYQGVIESIAEGLILYDDKGHIVTFNKSASKILRTKTTSSKKFERELREKYRFFKPNMELFPADNFPSKVTLRTGKPCSQVIMGVKDRGDLIWLSVNSEPFLQPNDRIGVVVSFSDITEQKVYEDRVTSVARELTTLIDTANAPIFGIDWNGRINEWNQVTAKITGYSKTEVLGKKLIDEFILDGYKVAVTDLLKNALRGKEVTNYELPIYTRTGKVVTILFNAAPRRNLDSEIIGVIGVGQNITELIEYRERLEMKVAERTKELNEALLKEKELVALKSKFVSMASHEFRTPLSTITFATNFIKRYKTKLDVDEIERKLDKIEEQVGHMTYLLDDVLLIGKSESGKIKLHPIVINIKDFCKKIIEEVTHSTKKTHKILFSIASEKKEIAVDEKLLRNILINLLTNAIKFSPGKDKILLDVVCAHGVLNMQVKDWGMGIEKEDQEKIFEPFHRTNSAGAIQGTGLGLSIVKKAVELQKGSVEVDSEIGKGTKIKIQIPLVDEKDISN